MSNINFANGTEDEFMVGRVAQHADAVWHDIKRVEELDHGQILLELEPSDFWVDDENAFTAYALVPFVQEGYIPTSVGTLKAWFYPLGAGIDIDPHNYRQ